MLTPNIQQISIPLFRAGSALRQTAGAGLLPASGAYSTDIFSNNIHENL
jgi:hypothetical protein